MRCRASQDASQPPSPAWQLRSAKVVPLTMAAGAKAKSEGEQRPARPHARQRDRHFGEPAGTDLQSHLLGPTTTSRPPGEFYMFAQFKLYPKARALLCGHELISMRGRAFDILLLLVSRAGTVVSPAELMAHVWPNVSVEEANLRVQMGTLRKVLSTCAEAKRAIETVPMRGYCFVLAVSRHSNEAPATLPRPRAGRGLPALLRPIVGREGAIEIVERALDERRLVSITGPGGIGKTTVAIATAARYVARAGGEIAFADLSQANDDQSIVRTISDSLGLVAPVEAFEAFTTLCLEMSARKLLLVLDTCEHIVDPMARFTETLLTHCSELKLLVTSREELRAAGEWMHRLPSLTFPEPGEQIDDATAPEYTAIVLFIDRVRWFSRFEVRSWDLPMAAEICRRLDGIPLALEFAAARVADLGLRNIVEQLDDRFAILTRGPRTALPRHRTLLATLDWSYRLLSADEQRMLRHLADHPGNFTAEHVHITGGRSGCEQPPEALRGLYEKSLVSVDMGDDRPSYRLLDTTRAYILNLSAIERA
jgi:predicted ATPase/DNA-binding winged helix-turn-helix (wHTH) protein